MLAFGTVALSWYESVSKWTSKMGGTYAATAFGVN